MSCMFIFGGFMNAAVHEKTGLERFVLTIIGIMPWAIVGTLLYAGLFVKPTVIINEVLSDKDKPTVKNIDDKTEFKNKLDEQILLLNKLKESI